jgi:hypothetical protein
MWGWTLEIPQLPARIRSGVDFRVSLRDHAVLVDHIRDAPRVFVLRRVTGAVCDADAAIDVAQERERKIEFLCEEAVLGLRVETDAEDLRVLRLVLGLEVPEPGTFPRSTGCVGLRIKPEHDVSAAQTGQRDAIAEVIDSVEVRRDGPGREHFRFSPEKCANDSSYGHRVYCSAVSLEEWNARYRIREHEAKRVLKHGGTIVCAACTRATPTSRS